MSDHGFDPTDFDNTLRQRHAEAVTHLSARAQAQLRNRLAAATSTPRHPGRRVAWIAATACAALFALVIGLQLRPQPAGTSPPATAGAEVGDGRADDDPTFVALDENPDLYLWLASSDAVTLASE